MYLRLRHWASWSQQTPRLFLHSWSHSWSRLWACGIDERVKYVGKMIALVWMLSLSSKDAVDNERKVNRLLRCANDRETKRQIDPRRIHQPQIWVYASQNGTSAIWSTMKTSWSRLSELSFNIGWWWSILSITFNRKRMTLTSMISIWPILKPRNYLSSCKAHSSNLFLTYTSIYFVLSSLFTLALWLRSPAWTISTPHITPSLYSLGFGLHRIECSWSRTWRLSTSVSIFMLQFITFWLEIVIFIMLGQTDLSYSWTFWHFDSLIVFLHINGAQQVRDIWTALDLWSSFLCLVVFLLSVSWKQLSCQ